MNPRAEVSVAGLLVGFCLLNYFYLIPTQVVAEGSSAVYPNLINVMLLCFSLAYLGEGVRLLRRERAAGEKAAGGGWRFLLRPVAMLVVTGAWVLTLEDLGFLLSTFFFLLIASRIFGSESWVKTIALSVIMPTVIYVIFRSLNSVLPEGPIEELIINVLG